MIIDTLDHRSRYADIPGLAQILDTIMGLDTDVEPGTIELADEIGAVNIFSYDAADPEVKTQFEAHRRFADVHVVLEGEETVKLAALDALTPATEFDEETDFGLHEGPTTVTVNLQPGWFVVAFPNDAHLPGVWTDGPSRVLKAVGKLRVA
ncbi:YhcH/YjgK/YiaL family protein [Tessaracoccus sp. MC1865]|uniref:YhcH/YjgK/YiaL family protein n=1 Tax=Tessaracoccus sp. MC1865 TaxID=2760310 RepID=UPI00160259BE|nr:YhcH/YjgK/YiaL family protein [Tessaracoccus sp. MC1865]MBB1483028.1 YhcH/YjgK/YiaL family protein [Tessaracoccus sp. MC1865]QTO37539.1 YhcH/YjgK/YiaL family protein [Tessaracoccus sp. MC1865]